ncbi:acyltransferase [uncultured Proteiniphilum sp.]|uniref:acyltransferase n=1 Tax=uncultured Proteiniphilum sp. TaxID=497637 RepID=UPI002625D103|nr:acyltransferase [uncultured Proteiniphilum sp.]
MAKLTERIRQTPRLKKNVLHLMMHPVKTRPRFWLRCLQFLYMKKGKRSVIYRSVRKDIVPFNIFLMGDYSVIEDYTVINNAVGNIVIGSHTRIGLGNTVIGPVTIGDKVNLAQNVVISGLDHNFEDIGKAIAEQGVSTKHIIIDDDVWIGANCVILAGIRIGKHVVIGAGSVVTKDVPSYSVALGNPAKVVRQYDVEKKQWIKVSQ